MDEVNKKEDNASLLGLYQKRVSRALKKLPLVGQSQPGKADSKQPYPELVKLIQLFNSEAEAPEVLYLGDSVLLRVSDFDEDRRKLGKMVGDNLQGKLRVGCVYQSAYHMRVYYHLLRAVETMKQQPRMVILPINMRSFSPEWDLDPKYQYDLEVRTLERYAADPRIEIPITEKVSRRSTAMMESYDATPVDYPLSSLNRIGQFRLILRCPPEYTAEQKRFRLQQLFIFFQTHPLLSSHPKVALLNDILEFLTRRGISVLTYVTPMNYQAGEKYVGEEFLKSYMSNVKVVENVISLYGESGQVSYRDWGTLLGSGCFFHEDNPTEHLNQEGRKTLAGEITDAVTELNQRTDTAVSN